MKGEYLLEEFRRRIRKEKGTKYVSDAVLAKYMGVAPQQLIHYRDKNLTPRQVVNIVEKHSQSQNKKFVENSISAIVEFLKLQPVESRQRAKLEIFSTKHSDGLMHPYYSGLRAKLEGSHGIYIFHDSRGRAIYAGKAQRLNLWTEMNSAFNRDRGDVQSIKRVSHPASRIKYKSPKELNRKIQKGSLALHEMAAYCSAYEVPETMIAKLEALIVRSFANDLLNARMENF